MAQQPRHSVKDIICLLSLQKNFLYINENIVKVIMRRHYEKPLCFVNDKVLHVRICDSVCMTFKFHDFM